MTKPAPRLPRSDDPNPLGKLMGRLTLWVAVGWLVVGVAFALILAALSGRRRQDLALDDEDERREAMMRLAAPLSVVA